MDSENGFSPYPDFFRTYNSQKHSQHLVFPSDYRQYYPKPLPETAVLKKPDEQFWNVKWTISEDETISFTDGWSKFVTDNGLIDGDKILFNYDGSRSFWICIYRNDVLVKSKAPINIQEISDDESETNGDDDYDMETEEDSNENKIISLSLGSSEEDDIDTTISEVNKASGTSSKKVRSGKGSKKKFVGSIGDPDMYLDDPLNPYFIARSSIKRTELVIARQVINDYELKFGDTINVMDGFGELKSNVGQWNDRLVVYKWNKICKRNDAKLGDFFICEILRERGVVQAIKAHFVKK